MSSNTPSTPIQKKIFALLLAFLGLGGAYAMYSVPASFEQARVQNLAIAKAERTAFWEAHQGAAVSADDANQVAFIASRATQCHPSVASANLEETRKAFIDAEAKCLSQLRQEYSAGEGYNRTVVLIDWAAANKS